jgi:hypothetical protein
VLGQPVGEALVQLGARRLGQGVVGRVADEEMAEAERVFARYLGLVGADELLAHERSQVSGHRVLCRCQRPHRSSVEDAALDRAALQDVPLRGVELIEPRCQ